MSDIVEKLKRIADASGYTDGTDTPLGEQVRAAAAEIERLRAALKIIAGSADRLQALQARAALDNIGAKV